MSDLLAEVDEAMRQERMEKFWAENKNYIVGFIVGTILLTAIMSFYNFWNHNIQEKQTSQLIAMQNADNYPQNIIESKKLELRSGLRGIILLQAAGTFADQAEHEKASTLYKRVSNDKSLPKDFQNLGILMVVRIGIDQNNPNGEKLLEQLKQVLADTKSPWSAHARLEAAVINAKLLSNHAEAIKHLDIIQNTPGLTESLYKRARALNHIYAMNADTAKNTEF